MESTDSLSPSARHARDLAFARRAVGGDPEAIERLGKRLACLPAMVRHQNRSLGAGLDETELEDVVRSTTVALWEKLPGFEGRSTLETWAFRFAMLEVLKAVHARARRPQCIETPEHVPDPPAEEDDPPPFERHELAAGLAALSEGAASVIRLRHWEGLPFEAIAERTGLPLNTVKARYYRGLARLKEILERRRRRVGS